MRAPAAVQVPVDEPAKAAEPSEVEFVASAHAFYRRYFTDRDPPPVVFKPDVPVVALWNSDSQGYEVNPDVVNRPGMDGYVALMGRFMQLHYTRCIEGSGTGTVDTWAWNEIRNSVVAYLVFTDPEQPANLVEPSTRFWPLWDALVALDEDSTASRDELRRLAFALLEGFECDWPKESLYDRIADTNEAAGTPVPDEALSAALKRAAAAAEPI